MATHSSVLAWRIPGTGEPGGVRSMGLHRVRYDWSDLAAAALDHKEGWALKNWCFWTVVLEKTLESPLDCKESILKEISPEYSLEGLVLKLKFQYFGHLHQYWCKESIHWKRPWCWERLRAAGEGDNRGWDGWMASLTQWTWVWTNSRRAWRTGKPGRSWGCKESDTTEWLNNNNILVQLPA